jgi:hypothetical protein
MSTMSSSYPPTDCPECGAPLPAGQTSCWLCQRQQHPGEQQNPYAPPRPIPGEDVPGGVSPATVILLLTLGAVCLGVFWLMPGLGVLLVFVLTPTLIRTGRVAGLRRRAGVPLSPGETLGIFFRSWFLMGAIGVAGLVAFMAVCVAGALASESVGGGMESTLGIGLGGGLLAAIPFTIWLLRITRPTQIELRNLPR